MAQDEVGHQLLHIILQYLCQTHGLPCPEECTPAQLACLNSPGVCHHQHCGSFLEMPGGNKYILVTTDCFIEFVEAFPMPNQEATSVADTFVTG